MQLCPLLSMSIDNVFPNTLLITPKATVLFIFLGLQWFLGNFAEGTWEWKYTTRHFEDNLRPFSGYVIIPLPFLNDKTFQTFPYTKKINELLPAPDKSHANNITSHISYGLQVTIQKQFNERLMSFEAWKLQISQFYINYIHCSV